MKHLITSTFIAWELLCACTSFSQAQTKSSNPQTVEQLASTIEKLRKVSDSTEFVSRTKLQEAPSTHNGGKVSVGQKRTSYYSIVSSGDNLFLERFYGVSQLPLQQSILLFKGDQAQILNLYVSEQGVKYSEGSIGEKRFSVRGVFANNFAAVDPRYYSYYTSDYPIDQMMMRKTKTTLDNWPQPRLTGESTIFNAKCVLVEFPLPAQEGAIVYALDIEHNYVIRQVADYAFVGTKKILTDVLNVPDLVKRGDAWYPTKVEHEIGKDSATPQNFYGSLSKVIDFKISPVEMDSRASFEDIRWPLGCAITDEINGKSYAIVAGSPLSNDNGMATASILPRAEDDPNNIIGLADPTMKVNQSAPGFSAVDIDGKNWTLSELMGPKVDFLLLTFFPKCFTGGCANHLSSLRDVYPQLQAAKVEVLAVSVDAANGEKGQKAFAKQWQLPFPLIPDTERKLSMLYGAAQNNKQLSARMSVLIDKQGIVRWIDTDVQVKTHGADVLSKISELGLNQ